MRRDVRHPLLAALACAALVIPLALVAYQFGPAARLDTALFARLAAPHGSDGYQVALTGTGLFNLIPYLALVAAVAALGAVGRRTRETLAALAIVVGANVTTQLLKSLLEHPRFQATLGFEQPWANSFPSGHTTAAAALAVALVLVVAPHLRPAAAAAGAAWTVAVGIGLVVIGAHYPSDVLGALLVVASWTLAAVAALRLLGPRRPQRRGNSGTASDRFAVSLQ